MHSVPVSVVANAFAVAQPASFLLLQRNDDASPFVACGCLGLFGLIMVGIIALNIVLLIWVARDAKSRGMDNAVVWMILVMLTGIIGLIIYLFTRPQGNLVPCPQCGNKRLQVSAKCPHCGNS
jgi:amino acid transporter